MRAEDAYVAVWRAARVPAERTGLLDALGRSTSRTGRHLRSMFAIHDVADMAALELAWWTYGAIAAVEAHLDAHAGQARVFEYGSGASTLWLGRRAGTVRSVEHDAGFHAFLQPLVEPLPHVEVRLDLLEQHLLEAIDGASTITKPLVDYDADSIEEETIDLRDVDVVVAEGTYTSLLKHVDTRVFIARNRLDTLEHRQKRNRGNEVGDPFIENVLKVEHKIIAGHRQLADFVITRDYDVVAQP